MPCLRANCATARPASPSLRIATICDSVNRDFFIGLPSSTKSCQKSPVLAVYREGKLTDRNADLRVGLEALEKQCTLLDNSHSGGWRKQCAGVYCNRITL